MGTRNINLELVHDNTAEAFIMALQRHSSENGRPSYILSDNASAYVRSKNELWKLIDATQTKTYLSEHNIKWKFSPKLSPQHNSVSESLVKVAKDALYGVFGTAILTETEFTTAMKLAQCRINQRPLVAMSDDPTDNNLLTITPHHLKLGRAAITLPSSLDELENLDNIRLSVQDRWNKRKILQEKFFVKWKDEYLSSLSKNKRIAESATDKPGSIVLLINERKIAIIAR